MRWNPIRKFAFITLATYVFLYAMSNQFVLTFLFDMLWQQVVPWVGSNILQLPEEITIFTNGSGDTTYNYVSLLVQLAIALIVAILVTFIDGERENYSKLFHWLVVLIRYYIIFQMVTYGVAKIFYMQFRTPSFDRLITLYGDSSPMGILWTFMGFSKGYTMFTGFGEFVGGLLLLFRKTRTLGAMMVFAVMVNVMALNFFYDVPVKILSSHLVFFALILIAIDGKRLVNMLVLNQATTPIDIAPNFENLKAEKITNISKWVLVIGAIGYSFYQTNSMRNKYIKGPDDIPLYGLYDVKTFVKNNDTLPANINDSARWHYLAIEWPNRATVYDMTKQKSRVNLEIDAEKQSVVFSKRGQEEPLGTLFYSYPDSAHFNLEGIYDGDSLLIQTSIKSKEDFLLMNRGFHWVSEYPFNR